MSTTELLRREWPAFRRPARLIALACAALAVVALGVLAALGVHAGCPGPCPPTPVTGDGRIVSDRFWFYHRDLGREGSITVRLASMTGTITYPPPNHDTIVPGLVPWAKTGIIVKDGLRQGSAYAALMMTGAHGVRLQYGYDNDIAGSASVATQPRWLRLTRSGDTITADESADGTRWQTVGTAALKGLPDVVQVGLFATSPGDLTLREVGLGGAIEEVRFTQTVGTFDNITVDGRSGSWTSESVGEMNHTDWEKLHNASGAVANGPTVTVSGTGDIGPVSEDGTFDMRLLGLPIALIILIVVGARFGARTARDAVERSVIAARAAILGAAAFLTAVLAVGIVRPVAAAILKNNGATVSPLPLLTGVRLVVGLAVAMALCAVLAYAVGVWVRRGWIAIIAGLTAIALPYAVASVPLLPDAVSQWLLRITPAAGFAVQQTAVAYPQVTAHYAPSAGYFPLPWWAGLAVLCAYTAVVLWVILGRRTRTTTDWR